MNRTPSQTPVLVLFFGSGAAGLLYQVVWIRLFVHVFGATVLAVSTVLAAFMGGLALGGLWGGRIVSRVENPLRLYGILEVALAIYAGLVPLFLKLANPLYASIYPALEDSFWPLSFLRFGVSALLLIPPTFLMGATLPLLTGHAERAAGSARTRVAALYAINTFGAVFGTVGASFVLLPSLGLSRTLAIGVALNVVVGLIAILVSRRLLPGTGVGREGQPPEAAERKAPDPPAADAPVLARPLILVTAGILGFSALALEVLWTRTLTLALGTTTYAFAIVLTVFLLGIASGSAAAGRILRNPRLAARIFMATPALIGLLALGLLPLFDHLPQLFLNLTTRGSGTWLEGLLVKFLVAGLAMLPPTFLSGAAFPLAVGIDRSRAGTSRSVGDVYASNTLGAILGSWIAGFVFVPVVGLRTGIILAAALQVAISVVLLLTRRGAGSRALAVGFAGATVAMIAILPDWNRSELTRGGFALGVDLRRYGLTELAEDRSELVFFREGINTTITVRRWGDEITMQMNGVTEASNHGDLATQVFVGGFGGILHEAPKDVLVIGLGSGITAAAAARHPGVKSVECVEISEAVVEAARLFDDWNHGILHDPRFRMIVGDGRNHLRLSGREYDVIVSQPSNVWNSGIGSLMSREFYRLAHEKLRPGGVLVSWIQGYSLTADALRSVLGAVSGTFPRVSLWMAGWGDLVIVAGDESFGVDVERIRTKSRDHAAVREMLVESDSPDMLSLLSRNLLAGSFTGRFIAGAGPNTDDNLYLEFAAPKFLYRETMPELFETLSRASGGTEEIVRNAPAELVGAIARAREARELETRARLAFRENRGDEGLAAIEEAYRLHPTAPSIADLLAQALSGRGEILARRNDLQGAVQHYLRAADVHSGWGEPFANLARLYADAKQIPTALEAIDEAIAREPRQPDFHAQRAELLLEARRFDDAREAALTSLAIDRRHLEAHLALGESLLGLERWEAADSVWTAGLGWNEGSEELEARRKKLRRLRQPAVGPR